MNFISSKETNIEYRRGTVLGLTVAEIFILLVFLLLLAFLALAQDWEEELSETKSQLAAANEQLQGWQNIVEEFQTPEEVQTLVARMDGFEQQVKEYRQQIDSLQEILDQEGDEAQKEVAELREQVQNLEEAAQTARQEAAQAKQDLEVFREKGHNPPCWYETVPDGKGGMREKPYYTFNMAVFDESIIVRQASIPPGNAGDDNGPLYSLEAERLGFAGLPYEMPLSNEGFIEHLKPIHDAGKNATVRSYSCIFWARVWDKTSSGAKERWKDAHDRVIEGLFGAYTVISDPWPEKPLTIPSG